MQKGYDAMHYEDFFDVTSFEHQQLFKTLQTPWDALKKLHDYLMSQFPQKTKWREFNGVYFEHPELISIGDETVIEPGVYIKGPCIIGKNCIIRHGAYIREDVLIGDGCVIGHATELKASILLNEAKVPHLAFVGDSIIGNHVNLGAGVKCANFRLDGKQIVIKTNKEKITTGLRKLGAIIGDNSFVGCNTVLNPGTVLGKQVCIFPGKVCGGFLLAKTVVK